MKFILVLQLSQEINTFYTHDNTIILATHDVSVGVIFKSLSGASTCGIRIALNANDIPITMWNEAATTATNACGSAVRKLFVS